jgi:glutamyl-tRNA reductase
MVIGAGKIGRSAAMALAERRPARLIVANRTPERAEEVARGLGAQVVSVAEMARVLPECDLALGAAFAPHFLVTRAMFEAVRASAPARPVCLIDAAVPRILDRAIGELPGVTLFDLGDLEEIIARHRDRRAAAAQEAWAIVESEVEKYRRAVRSMELGPWIDLLRQRFDSAATEVESGANSLDSDRRLKQRLLHEAIAVLKELHGDDRTRIG